jgi:hypothetical protein
MYQVDDLDKVRALPGIPQSSVGAPCPVVLGDEHSVAVAFYVETSDPTWDGSTVRMVDPTKAIDRLAIVCFRKCRAHFSGPPNDEAFAGHPLASRGLRPYGAFQVLSSSWIREMERRNEVHDHHRGGWLSRFGHYALTFHDSIVECVAEDFSVEQVEGTVASALQRMSELIR